MRRSLWLAGFAGLVLASTGSLAFDQQKPGTATSGAPAAAQPDAGTNAFVTPDPAPRQDRGSEIRVPGLGLIGVLPKMDFGLELLYGANDKKGLEGGAPEIEKTEPGELAVKGRVMRRF